ncbi:unnamed protein product [Mytilus coruscus]|uniref:Uncharacterized protein n=1 Tax=Mytilus coruscus TaxID=42192 RepID=A0A6J8B0L8_MYTCO|nr:unnamed protein product [Mytilus coruscus]
MKECKQTCTGEMMNSRIISVIAVIGMIFVCSIRADGLYDNYVHQVPLAYPVPHPISAPPQGLGSVAGNPLNLQSDQSLLSKSKWRIKSQRMKKYRERKKASLGEKWLIQESNRTRAYYKPTSQLNSKEKKARRERIRDNVFVQKTTNGIAQ